MRFVNVRLLGTLAVGFLVLCGGSYFLHAYQVQRHAGVYLREARRAQEENRPTEAVRHLRRYVKLAPDDTEALALYGVQLAELDQHEPAFLVLEQALRREPDRDEWRRQLVGTAIDLERYSDARANLEEHLLKRSPDDAALLMQLGRCHVALNENEGARKAFEAAIAAEPQQLEAYVLLAGLYRNRFKDEAAATRWIDQMVVGNSSNAEAYLVRGEWKLSEGQWHRSPLSEELPDAAMPTLESASTAAVKEDAEHALELAPGDTRTLLFAARVFATTGEHDKAHALAKRVQQAEPNQAAAYMLLAEIETAAGRQVDAVESLRKGVDAVPHDLDLRWNFARLLIESDRHADAREELAQLRDDGYPSGRVSYLDARIEIANENWLEGIRTLDAARPGLEAWPDLIKQSDYWLSACYDHLGNSDQQLTALRRAIAVDPSFIRARLDLAAELLATRRIEEAQEHYRYLASLPAAPAVARLKLTKLEIAAVRARRPAERDWSAIELHLGRLAEVLPDAPEVALLRAEVLVAQDKSDEAERLLADASRRDGGQIELFAAQVELAERAGHRQKTEALIEGARSKVDAVELAALKARILLRRNEKEVISRLEDQWDESKSMTVTDRARFAEHLTGLALAAGALDLAAATAETAAVARPNDLPLRQVMLDLAVRRQKFDQLDAILTEIHRIEGTGALWHYGKALQLMTTAQGAKESLEHALKEAQEARNLRPDWSKPVLLSAEILDRQGDASRAANAYVEAISMGERHVPAITRAVTLLIEQNRFADADRMVRRLQEQQAGLTDNLTRLAAQTSLRLEEFDRATDLALSFAVDSDRMEDHLWAGQTLGLLGQFDEAETRLQRALEIDSRSPEPRIALVRVLVRAGQLDDAETAIDAAKSAVPPELSAITAAECYEVLGNAVAADENYRAALSQTPNDPRVARRAAEFFLKIRKTAEAEPHLRRFIAGEIAATEADLEWARRSLAMIVGTRGDERGLNEALALLDANHDAASSDVRARAIVLASQPSATSRTKAIDLLNGLVADERTALAEDRFLLAELLRRRDDMSNAADQLRKALASDPDEPRYVTAYAQILIQRSEPSEALLWIDRLKKIAPDERSTIGLEAQALFAAGQSDRAATALKQYALEGKSPTETAERRLWVIEQLGDSVGKLRGAGSTDSDGLTTATASLIEEHLRDQPQDKLRVARVSAQLGHIDEALSALAGSSDSPPELIEPVAIAVMTCPTVTQEQLAELQRLLEDSIGSSGRATPLLAVSADLLGWRGDLPAASERYRELLERNANDVRALNNLAIVLALGERKYDVGLALINRAIEIAGPYGALIDTLGLVQLSAGKTEEAQKNFERALEESAVAERYVHLAAAQWHSHEKEHAKRTLHKAVSLGVAWEELHPLERPLFIDLRSELK